MRLVALCAFASISACRTPAAETKHVPSAPPSTAAPSRVDELFRSYEQKLPEAETLSEQNGASLECEHHGWVTYTLLYATAQKLPIENDADLLRLVPWARSGDVCIRQIAIEAIIARIKFDSNRVSLPGMHEPEHHHFHEIFVALRAYLAAHNVAAPALFSGMYLDIAAKDFAMMKGRWEEESTPSKNFQTSLEFDGDLLRVTTKHVKPDPAWPDHTWTTKVKDIVVNERGQFVVTGDWNIESNAKGYQGTKIAPSQFTYAFWPITADIVWFDEGRTSWTKMHRVGS